MSPEIMKKRTKAYALRVVRLAQVVSATKIGKTLADQLLRSGTSVGANYRAACRARSQADFVAKLKIVEEECDESLYWMELVSEAQLVPHSKIAKLYKEGEELLAIVVASIKTVRAARNGNRQSSIVNRKFQSEDGE